MSEHDARRRRLVADELVECGEYGECGECGDADVHERLASLDALVDAIPGDDADDSPARRTLDDDTRHRIVGIRVAAFDATRGAGA